MRRFPTISEPKLLNLRPISFLNLSLRNLFVIDRLDLQLLLMGAIRRLKIPRKVARQTDRQAQRELETESTQWANLLKICLKKYIYLDAKGKGKGRDHTKKRKRDVAAVGGKNV